MSSSNRLDFTDYVVNEGHDDFTKSDLVNVLKGHGMMAPFDPDWKDKRAEIIDDPEAAGSESED